MAKIVDLKGEWASAIGKAFVAFGSIEHVTATCLRQIPRDRLQRSTKLFRLAQRIELLLEMLEAYQAPPYMRLSDGLRRAKQLAKTRNLIAHNPLVFEIYEWLDGTLFHQEVIAAMHKDRKVTLQELQAFAEQSEALASELYSALTEVLRVHGLSTGS